MYASKPSFSAEGLTNKYFAVAIVSLKVQLQVQSLVGLKPALSCKEVLGQVQSLAGLQQVEEKWTSAG